jgi:hypothetical protein
MALELLGEYQHLLCLAQCEMIVLAGSRSSCGVLETNISLKPPLLYGVRSSSLRGGPHSIVVLA